MNSREIEDQPSHELTPHRPAADAAIDDSDTAPVEIPATTESDERVQKAPWLIAANVKPDAISSASPGCNYHFSSQKAATKQLAIIHDLLINTCPDIQKISVKHTPAYHKTPYCISLTAEQHKSLEKLKASDRLVKVIRWDTQCFIEPFILGITRTPAIQHRQSLRSTVRGKYTVFASGAYPRNAKPQRYSPEELSKKSLLSQHQSTSLVTYEAQCPVFGHDKDRREKLVGVMLDPNDAIINRLFIYDGGTFNRPYEFSKKDKALKYHRKKTSPHSQVLFESIQQFKSALPKSAKDKYNEVLARIRWDNNSSSIGIFSDTFESRCIAQYYAEILLARLKQSYAELGKKWDETYRIPIIFYLPNNIKNWTIYSDEEQQRDIKKANDIFNNKKERIRRIYQNKGEFLLILPNADAALEDLHKNDSDSLMHTIRVGDFQLLRAIFSRTTINKKYSLSDFLSCYLPRWLDRNIFFLIYHDYNVDFSTLYLAAKTGYEDIVAGLLSSKSIRPAINNYNDKGCSPLYIAAQNAHLAVVNTLLEHGANVNQALTTDGSTPLFVAAQNGHLDAVKTLLEHGANINQARTTDGSTPLYVAAQEGHLDVVNTLLEHGANVNQAHTTTGATPLLIAAQEGHLDVVNTLLEHGANVNQAITNIGTTPLFIAAQQGHLDVVNTLLEHGANINQACTTDGTTPLFIAAQQGHLDVVKTLLEHGADDRILNIFGDTALQIAVSKGHFGIVKILTAKSLMRYIENRDLDHRDYKQSLALGRFTFNFGYSKTEQLNAAIALLTVVNGDIDVGTLGKHDNILSNDDLEPIYRAYKEARRYNEWLKS